MSKKNKTIIIICFILLFIINFNPIHINATSNKSNSEKVIYLTFDDGPGGKITEETLNILKEQKVHATFFLIGNQISGQESLVKRIHKDGHSIGLHSMTHNKNILYSSNTAFLKEMIDEENLLKDIIGYSPKILRFPFGCNNNNYCLTEKMVDLLHENGYKIYDWTVDTTDGANPNISPSIYVNNAISDSDTIVLLMHCGFINKTSPKALPEIIKYYKQKGYTFKTISYDTEEVYHYKKR